MLSFLWLNVVLVFQGNKVFIIKLYYNGKKKNLFKKRKKTNKKGQLVYNNNLKLIKELLEK